MRDLVPTISVARDCEAHFSESLPLVNVATCSEQGANTLRYSARQPGGPHQATRGRKHGNFLLQTPMTSFALSAHRPTRQRFLHQPHRPSQPILRADLAA